MPNASAPKTLLDLGSLPTVAGRERHVIRYLDAWLAERPSLRRFTDDAGNILITHAEPTSAPIIFTAHLDHPGFVIEKITGERAAELAFRGGVHAPYFTGARVALHPADPESPVEPVRAVITDHTDPSPPDRPDRTATIEAESSLAGFTEADIAVWDLPEPSVDENGVFHARVCDDLAALAAALDALDELGGTDAAPRVGLLCTRAEEVGFTGAIAACRSGLIPESARLLALENSRSFPDSPLHAGPIVRVGDRVSTFSPTLNAAVARCAQRLTGGADPDVGRPEIQTDPGFKWQRKLMPGGACEATAFYAYGYEATCLCLPLGNYHNMAELAEYEQAVRDQREPTAEIAREFISLADYHGLVRLLVACGRDLESAEPIITRLEKLYDQRKHILTER